VRQFTVYVDRDIPIECNGDQAAVEIAQRIHDAVDRVIEELVPGVECYYACSTCQRGRRNKIIFEQERGED
jgi:hypothetical protein